MIRSRLLAAALTLGLAAPVAAIEVQLTRQDLCKMSDAVVLAEVTSSEVRWAKDGTIETRFWLATERVLYGGLGDTIETVVPGGTIGDSSYHRSSVPELKVDHRFLIFAQKLGGDRVQIPGSQGAVLLEGGAAGGQGEATRSVIESLEGCRVR